MLSFISVPPRSLAPAFRHIAAPSGPIFTQEVWIFVISGCSTSRDTACIRTASRSVGPFLAMPRRYIGASMCTNGSGTNSVKPPVSACRSRKTSKCRAQFSGLSTCPYMMVDVVRSPSACAALATSIHCCVLILSGQIIARISSSSISAAVPGNVPSPASFSRTRKSVKLSPSVAAPCVTSSGEKAWMCIPGTAALIALQIET